MKIGLLSGIHGNLPALEACWSELKRLGADLAVNLGNVVQYGPFPSEALEFVRERPVESVQGSCDRAVARGRSSDGGSYQNVYWRELASEVLQWTASQLTEDDRRYLRKLPEELRYEVGGTRLLCVHGLPGKITEDLSDDLPGEIYDLLLRRNDCHVLVTGHGNRILMVERRGGWIVSPGSVGGGTLPGAASLAMLSLGEGRRSVSWHRVEYDFDRYERAYRGAALPDIFLRCLRLGRDPRGRWHAADPAWRERWARRS
jgi:putative phosphoesterase